MEQQENREEALDKVADKIADTLIEMVKGVQITCIFGSVAPSVDDPVTGTFQCVIS